MDRSRQAFWRESARRRNRRRVLANLSGVVTVVMALAIGALGGVWLQNSGMASWVLDAPAGRAAQEPDMVARDFALCAGPVRVTCVVDGDTFWLDGDKIRIADINAPETGQPQCGAEAALGRQAATRLMQLLGDGPFRLEAADRDVDQYGRKLRIVVRDGRSLGDIMVAEGLAHEWRGRRESWCR